MQSSEKWNLFVILNTKNWRIIAFQSIICCKYMFSQHEIRREPKKLFFFIIFYYLLNFILRIWIGFQIAIFFIIGPCSWLHFSFMRIYTCFNKFIKFLLLFCLFVIEVHHKKNAHINTHKQLRMKRQSVDTKCK